MSKEKDGVTVKQYPGYFKGKKVFIRSMGGEITRGLLTEIQEYGGSKLLIVQISTDTERMVAFDHVIYIDEL